MILVGGPFKEGHLGKRATDATDGAGAESTEEGGFMNEVFDYGTGVPYTHEDLEVLFRGKVTRRMTDRPAPFAAGSMRPPVSFAGSGHLCEMGGMRKVLRSGRKDVSGPVRELPAVSSGPHHGPVGPPLRGRESSYQRPHPAGAGEGTFARRSHRERPATQARAALDHRE